VAPPVNWPRCTGRTIASRSSSLIGFARSVAIAVLRQNGQAMGAGFAFCYLLENNR
jgi:hypothetical protein